MKKISLHIGMMLTAFILMSGTALGAQLTLSSNMACDQLSIGGTVSSTLIVGGNTLDVGTGGIAIAANGTLTSDAGSIQCAGDWSNSGTFTAGTGTVSLDGTGKSLSGSTSFYNLSKTVSLADTLTFQAGSTTTVTGTLTLQGASGEVLSLRSSTPGTQWNINPSDPTVGFLNVQDSKNTNATAIDAGANSVDSGNNTHWSFPGAPSVTTQAVNPIGATTATGNGTMTALGTENPTQHGVCWSTSENPTISLPTKTTQGVISETKAFTSSMTGLTAETLYYVRAYATNSYGTSYGDQVSFTTIEPTVTTAQDGDWSDTTTWEGGVLPTADDNVILAHDVHLNTNAEIQDLTVNPVKSLTIDDGSHTLKVNGTLSAAGSIITFTGGGTLDLAGTVACDAFGTVTCGTGTVIYSAVADQNIDSLTYYNLITSGSGIKTLCGNVTVENTLNTGAGTTFALSDKTLNLGSDHAGTGWWTNAATFDNGTGTVNYAETGDQTILALEYYGLGVAGTGSTKTFENGITKVGAEISLTDTITLTGSSAGNVTVEAGGASRVFNISLGSGKSAAIRNLTITGGNAGDNYGGGIYFHPSDLLSALDLENCEISVNTARDGGGVFIDGGLLNVDGCTFTANNATRNGGGLAVTEASLNMRNCTISGNTGADYCGGIAALNASSVLYLINTTIRGNDGGLFGPGGFNNDNTTYLLNTIVINNTKGAGVASDIWSEDGGTITAYYSWYGAVDGVITTQAAAPNVTTAYTAGDLGALADNGGPTLTMALSLVAPAFETGALAYYNADDGYYFYDDDDTARKLSDWPTPPSNPQESDKITTDQRGADRHDIPCIGAYELYAEYTSKAAGGWENVAKWKVFNGVDWDEDPSEFPTADNSTKITVDHDIEIIYNITIDQTTVSSSATLIVNTIGETLTIADGDGVDLTVTGDLVNADVDVNTITCQGDSTVLFNGTDQNMGGNAAFQNVEISGGGTKTPSGDNTINQTLTLTNGLVSLGDNDLTLGENANIGGTPSAASMIVTGGTGTVKKVFSSTGSFTFPVGDTTDTAEFSPATLDFTGGTFNSAWAGVKVTNSKQPDNTSTTDYLDRYWSVTQSGISGFSCDTTFTYLPADVVGTEASVYAGQWNGSKWTVFDPVNPATHSFEATVSSFSDFTGVERPAPETQAANISFSNVGITAMTVRWTRGDGDKVLVVARQGSAVNSPPVDGTAYTAGAAFGTGTQIGTGNYVVYKGTGTGVTVTGLSPASTYYFRAYEYNDRDSGPVYNTETATGNPNSRTTLPNPPAAPVAAPATGISGTGFTANWNTAAGSIAYRLDVSTSSTFATYLSGYESRDVGNTTSEILTGLSNGTTYYYRVRAVNTGGSSGNSNRVSVATVCSAPVATTATAITYTGFTANWNGVTGAEGYRLDVSTSSAFSSYVIGYQNKDMGTAVSGAVSGLSPATSYYYRVRAINASGTGDNSNTVEAVTPLLPTRVNLTGPSAVNAGAVSSAFTLTSQDGNGNPAAVDQDTVFGLTSKFHWYGDVLQ